MAPSRTGTIARLSPDRPAENGRVGGAELLGRWQVEAVEVARLEAEQTGAALALDPALARARPDLVQAAQTIAMRDASGVTYLHGNHIGSVSIATNQAGAVTSQQSFDPWGRCAAAGSARPA